MRIINTTTAASTLTPATLTPATPINAFAVTNHDSPTTAACLAINAARLALRAAEAVGTESDVEEAEELLRDTEERALGEVGWRPISDLKIVEDAIAVAQLGGSWDNARRLAARALELADARRIADGRENPLDRARRAHVRALVLACDWESQIRWVTGCELGELARFDYAAGEFPAAAGGIIGRYESDYWPQTVEYLVARDEVPLFGDPAGWMLLYVQQQ
jgi:hypothetical protein